MRKKPETSVRPKRRRNVKYVGLTDDPILRKEAHGNPKDWKQFSFSSESEALKWEKETLAKPGHEGGLNDGRGWRYGYIYTISGATFE